MKNGFLKVVVVLIFCSLGAYVWFGYLDRQNLLQGIVPVEQEVAGEITSFYVARPNLVVETTDLAGVTLYATPADRTKEDAVIGRGVLVEEFGSRQTWTIEIPESQLLRKIYVIGVDDNGITTERTVFPIAGIVDIYRSLWVDAPEVVERVSVGDSIYFDDVEIVFNRVLEDSRCPVGSQCIQAGRLVIELGVLREGGVLEQYVLSSNEEDIHMKPYFITILNIDPPAQEENIQVSEYNIALSIIGSI